MWACRNTSKSEDVSSEVLRSCNEELQLQSFRKGQCQKLPKAHWLCASSADCMLLLVFAALQWTLCCHIFEVWRCGIQIWNTCLYYTCPCVTRPENEVVNCALCPPIIITGTYCGHKVQNFQLQQKYTIMTLIGGWNFIALVATKKFNTKKTLNG